MSGRKQSHLPTLPPGKILDARSVIAVSLGMLLPCPQIPDIRAVLRCRGPEEVRRLLARGNRLLAAERARKARGR